MEPHSLYIHIPFCVHRCAYCDFNTYAGLEALIPAYCRALRREIELVAAGWQVRAAEQARPVHTIFFGGGTPSLLPASELAQILETIRQNFNLAPAAEISLEANPGTVNRSYLTELHQAGVNRLSFGVQSANPSELALLERQHSYFEVIEAVQAARQAGFTNLNLDLIFGLPYQTLESWQHSLSLVLDLHPEHFALYALTLEHGTPMAHWANRGLLPVPDPDLAAEMYEWASDCLESHGYAQYEISNWAQPDQTGELLACRHNLQYWRGLPYLGLGAGAHGYAAGVRTVNTLAPAAYIQRLQSAASLPPVFPRSPAMTSATPITRQDELGETMMMGLRLLQEGITERSFSQRFGASLEATFSAPINRLQRLGLLEWVDAPEPGQRALRLTKAGRLLGNQVFVEFI